ncbi:MAG TPA: hypothetical protein PKD86_17110 [Gemmatales bacterium]|mgnify:CR=1 FL=1|nr:hypothetical protein [Gemmatales bacterium]HMP61065.1 hypothetical protein [Gemmatales bacterium]
MDRVLQVRIAIYVDRQRGQWVVRDGDGRFWALPAGDDAWQRRQPCDVRDEDGLEPVPGHYRSLLGIP